MSDPFSGRFSRTVAEAVQRHKLSRQVFAPRMSDGAPIHTPRRERFVRWLRRFIWG